MSNDELIKLGLLNTIKKETNETKKRNMSIWFYLTHVRKGNK